VSGAARAAVVTVAHNSSARLGEWVDALERSGARDRLELCVVDSGSGPEELEATRTVLAGRVESFLCVPNLGFGRASNVGVAWTSAPVLIFLNPDARLETLPDDLLDPAQVARTIVGPELLLADGAVDSAGFRHLPTARWEAVSLLLGRRAATYERAWSDPAYISGGTLLMTRADFERLGGFSPELFLYFEDADLCRRHRREGGGIRVDRRWSVHHDGADSSSNLWRPDALDGLARWSARRLAAREEGRLAAGLLWVLLALVYVPRRGVAELRRGRRRSVTDTLLDLVLPSRILRRLNAVPPDPVTAAA